MDLQGISREQKAKYFRYLSGFITPERMSKIEEVSLQRTRHLTIVLEDIFQSHNISAVLRSCDCFGILDVHIIENENGYQVNPDIALGSAQWLNLNRYHDQENNTATCISRLKKEGYRIVAASPHKNDHEITELDISSKTALIFGTELEGLSEQAMGACDAFVRIPMKGFTESLNISVSAAICLFTLTERLRKSTVNWQLGDDELMNLRIAWIKNNLKKANLIERDYFANKTNL